MKKTLTHFDVVSKAFRLPNIHGGKGDNFMAVFQQELNYLRHPETGLIDKDAFRLWIMRLFQGNLHKMHPNEMEVWETVGLYSDRGQQNIHVGPVLERMLASTDVTSVPKEFLKFPFDAFYIVFEDSPHYIWDGHSENIQVKGAYVVPGFRGDNVLKIVVWGADSDTMPKAYTDDAASDLYRKQFLNDAMNWTTFDLDDLFMSETGGYDFEKSIRRIMSDPTKDTSVNGATTKPGNIEVMVNVMRTVINTIMFTNSEHADMHTTPRKKAKIFPKKFRNKVPDNRPTVTYLGRKYETSENRNTFVKGSRQCRRHIRKGHWRGVWIGTRKDDKGNPRKGERCVLRWIMPTLVNKDAAIEVPKATYVAPEPPAILGSVLGLRNDLRS